jgi:hypothetical protein
VRAKGVCANQKVSWCNKRWLLGAIKNIVVQQKMASRWIQKYQRYYLGKNIMWLEHLLGNLLIFFLPSVIAWTVGILALSIVPQSSKKKFIVWGDVGILGFVIMISYFTAPEPEPLQMEIAFYALQKKQDNVYALNNLLVEENPEYLGLTDTLGYFRKLPVARSGEELKIRLRLNQDAHIYIFHFDTTEIELRQIFPAQNIDMRNPLHAESWIELPSPISTWTLDTEPGLEAFVIFATKQESNEVREDISKLLQNVKGKTIHGMAMIQKLDRNFVDFWTSFLVKSDELVHGIYGASPKSLTTRIYRGREKHKLMIWQYVQHN